MEFQGDRSRARWAVIFESVRRASPDGADDGYEAMAEAMRERVRSMPGFVDVTSARGPDGAGITVSYWESREAIARWKADRAHAVARARGRETWYASYRVTVARLESPATPSEGDVSGGLR